MDTFETRRRFSDDPHRPAYHFLAPSNFMGDPNGPIFWDGQYHLFYQYNPDGAYDDSRRMHWGHAASADLLHWTDLPIALSPDPDGPDRSGCFSGGAINWDGVPTLIYYGNPDGICLATSSDNLSTWQKHPANPVIPHPPRGKGEWRAFDPCAWKEGETWYSLSGGRVEGVGDTAFLFESPDLVHWDHKGLFYGPGTENDCAVPDFFPLGDKHVLLFASHKRGVQYYVGTYADHRFHPEQHGRMNYGAMGLETGNLCAGFTMLDGKGRRLFFGWVPEGRTEAAQRQSGWAGVMCLPRLLSLEEDFTLRIEPAPELKALRSDHYRVEDLPLAADSTLPIDGVEGDCLEIAAEVELGDAEEVGLKVRRSPDGEEQTLISYSRPGGFLSLDPEASSLSPEVVGRELQRGTLELAPGEPLRIRVFLDRSIVEAFANDRQCLTKRVYPSRADSLGVALFARGGPAVVRSLDLWRMASVWPGLEL